tara:strand:- start:2450 stop:2641 length:192 start_codon:yes stop_codon:yes gene_type:complete
MATKYVVELTKAQLSIIRQAMNTHDYEIDTLGYTSSEKACFDRTHDKILNNIKTKAEYLRENK